VWAVTVAAVVAYIQAVEAVAVAQVAVLRLSMQET
jgi:hypothetical protein